MNESSTQPTTSPKSDHRQKVSGEESERQRSSQSQLSPKRDSALRSLGVKPRAHRVRELRALLYANLLEQAQAHAAKTGKHVSKAQVRQRVEQLIPQFEASQKFINAFDRWTPVLSRKRPRGVHPYVELLAMSRVEELVGLDNWMLSGWPRRQREREGAWALLKHMGLAGDRPEEKATYNLLAERPATLDIAHGHPHFGSYERACSHIRTFVAERTADVTQRVNMSIFQRIAARYQGELGVRGVPPMLPGVYLAVDGKLIRAFIQQKAPRSREHARELRGVKWDNTGYTKYNGKRCHGYKLMVISDIATGLPLVWELIPANGNERKSSIRLLRMLFEMWPDCPAWALVGDGLYAQSDDWLREVYEDWGLFPCVRMTDQRRRLARAIKEQFPHGITDTGVPKCACKEPMKLWKNDFVWDSRRRARHGIKRGEKPPRLDARQRWRCANDDPKCQVQHTVFQDAPMHFPYLLRSPGSDQFWIGRVLETRRASVEAVFASVSQLGVGAKDLFCPRWAGDDGMAWLCGLGLLSLSARVEAHQAGHYERAAVLQREGRFAELANSGDPMEARRLREQLYREINDADPVLVEKAGEPILALADVDEGSRDAAPDAIGSGGAEIGFDYEAENDRWLHQEAA